MCTYKIQEISTPHLLPSKSCNGLAEVYHVVDFNIRLEVVMVVSLECSHVGDVPLGCDSCTVSELMMKME